jgi:hypothetical protein
VSGPSVRDARGEDWASPDRGGARRGGRRDHESMNESARMTREVVPRRALVRWMIPVYAGLSAALLPWAAYLAWTLPARNVSNHYRLAWVGFDLMLCAALGRTAYLAWRRSPFVVNVASATAALLVVDAWFDVTTSPGGNDLMVSVLLALLVELPLAGLSLVLAARAQIEIARTGVVRQRPRVLRWMAAGTLGEPVADVVAKASANAPLTDAAALDVAPPEIVAAGPSLAAPKPLATDPHTSARGTN